MKPAYVVPFILGAAECIPHIAHADDTRPPTGPEMVFAILDQLHEKFHSPLELRDHDLLNAAIAGMRTTLTPHAPNAHLDSIPAHVNQKKLRKRFVKQFERAIEHGAPHLFETDFAIVAIEAMLKSVGDSHTYLSKPARYIRQGIVSRGKHRYGYLFLPDFGSETTRYGLFYTAQFTERGVDGIIFDLRGNTGGYSKPLLDYLFPRDTFLYCYRSKRDDWNLKAYYAPRPGAEPDTDTPIVVLINEKSVSAAEVFAAVVQEQKRGTIIGVKSAGEVSSQQGFSSPFGGYCGITAYEIFTAGGKSFEGIGITPDIAVAEPERQLDVAFDTLDTLTSR